VYNCIVYILYYILAYPTQQRCLKLKPSGYVWFETLEIRHCTVLLPKNGTFKARYFCRTLDKFTQRAKPIRITGDPNNQRPDKWSSAVHKILDNRHCGFKCDYIYSPEEENKNTMQQYIGCLVTSSKPTMWLRMKCCIIFSLFSETPTEEFTWFDLKIYALNSCLFINNTFIKLL
jgi:hypothetical protein